MEHPQEGRERDFVELGRYWDGWSSWSTSIGEACWILEKGGQLHSAKEKSAFTPLRSKRRRTAMVIGLSSIAGNLSSTSRDSIHSYHW